jgi:hypothetical protein
MRITHTGLRDAFVIAFVIAIGSGPRTGFIVPARSRRSSIVAKTQKLKLKKDRVTLN